jgi:hypothetical protein
VRKGASLLLFSHACQDAMMALLVRSRSQPRQIFDIFLSTRDSFYVLSYSTVTFISVEYSIDACIIHLNIFQAPRAIWEYSTQPTCMCLRLSCVEGHKGGDRKGAPAQQPPACSRTAAPHDRWQRIIHFQFQQLLFLT